MLERTHLAVETAGSAPGTEVVLAGWVSRRRDLGSLIFIDLRDRSGIVQLVFDTERGTIPSAMETASSLRSEYVVQVRGHVVARDEKSVNPKLVTGRVEVLVQDVTLLNAAKTPPFYIQDGVDVDEAVRLRYRYLDLRRPEMQRMLRLRHQVYQSLRRYLNDAQFVEVETPVLTKSTPEGARDYLVPSRLQPGSFYALPQSPQLFKQLLMVAGMERYYQFARCFRDEDLRADRQPEFTQLDIEQSFIPLPKFQAMMEEMMARLFEEVLGVRVETPFLRLTYDEAMDRYGSDKPDLRYGLEICDLSEMAGGMAVPLFQAALADGGVVRAIAVPGAAGYSRKQTDELVRFVQAYGLGGLATIALQPQEVKSSMKKFLDEAQLRALAAAAGAAEGDLVLLAAGSLAQVRAGLGALRVHLGHVLQLADPNVFKFLWVVDFPLLSYDEEEGRFVAEHHPFTMPKWEDLDKLETDPQSVRAQAYDMVLNGYEIGGGSMRIFQRAVQERMFRTLGFTMEEAYRQFGFLLDAFEYGTPPHGGIAFGIDRIVMLMGGGQSLRDCIAFPKTSSGTDLLTAAPSPVSDAQLDVLHLSVRPNRPKDVKPAQTAASPDPADRAIGLASTD
ncbi:MAG: aspartate--tRNA ligase [Alicyclobacillus sp.]|nr:aspartate--tRNA ligase [Alicyclobacillus sp.]